jgi:hypothetical protein
MLQGHYLSRSSAFTPDGVAYLFGGVYEEMYDVANSVVAAEAYDPTYIESPVVVSRAFHTGYADFGQISLTSELPAGTAVFVSTRTSADGANWTEWSEEMEAPGGAISSPPGDYFQYRLRLATSDPYRTARVYDVSFSYNRAPGGGMP